MIRALALAIIIALTACSSPQSVSSDTPEKPAIKTEAANHTQAEIDAAALALLKHHDGIWDSRWEWFGPDGEVVGESTGTEEYTLVGDGYSQTMVNKVPQFDQISHGLLAYYPVKKEILFLSVGAKGDYWLMRQDPITGSIVSDPHIDADGNGLIIRFTTLEKSDNAMKIQMESSKDGGQTWTVGFHQYSERRV